MSGIRHASAAWHVDIRLAGLSNPDRLLQLVYLPDSIKSTIWRWRQREILARFVPLLKRSQMQKLPRRAHTDCRIFKRSSHSCTRRRDNASVNTLKTNHIRVYLPERATSHPQSWSCSAVWARFCGNMHRLYMPFIWRLTIAMTRNRKKYCRLLCLSSSHWMKPVPALSQTHFRILGQWFLPHR